MKIIKKVSIAALFLSSIIAGIWWYLYPIIKPLPVPTGPYKIGQISYQLHGPQDDFMVCCWYPADISTSQQQNNRYGDAATNAYRIQQISHEMHMPQFFLHNAFNFFTHSILDAPLSTEQQEYPVIVFMPGNNASYYDYTALLENVASHGYIVVGVNTPLLNPTTFSDGHFVAYKGDFWSQDNGMRDMMDRCIANVASAVDWLTTMQNDASSMWHHSINLQKLGIMGHSFGGSAAVEVVRHGNRFIAGINLDGWLEMRSTNKLLVPFLFLMNDSLYPPGKEEGMQEIEQTCAHSGDTCRVAIVPDAGHNSFADYAFYRWPFNKRGDFGNGDPHAVFKKINTAIQDFLSHYLSSSNGKIVLINGTSSAGKTSVVKALQKIYGDSYVALLGDEFLTTYAIEHPKPESMTNDAYQFQILTALCTYAKQLALDGKNVFLEMVEFDEHYEQYCSILDCDTTVKILVYCPLDIIVEHIGQRNKLGDENEQRDLLPPFQQFAAIYKLQDSPDELVVDSIATSRMRNALQVVAQEINMFIKEAGISASFEHDIFYKNFVEHYKLDTLQEIVLVPIHKWDLVVNAGINSPEEIAHKISALID